MLKIDGNTLRNMFIAGANALNAKKDEIDELNVFPVPDGDTGTNMSLTVLVAAQEAEGLVNKTVDEVAKAVSSGSLRGARGNSGVILSQLFRGFSKGLKDTVEADVDQLANAFAQSVETAYKAVMKPKEGTILTVAKAMSEKAAQMAFCTDEIEVFLAEVIKAGNEMLAKTTDMLPALKEAGVVDAGGQGLVCFLTGAYNAITAGESDFSIGLVSETINKKEVSYSDLTQSSSDIKFCYCTEFFVLNDKFEDNAEDEFKSFLDNIGDSIVVVADEGLMKVHVHTNNPGTVLEKALTYGQLNNMKIENMRIQHTEKVGFLETDNSRGDVNGVGFVAVSTGDGLEGIFKSLGVDVVLKGGQTMNPSSDDILAAAMSVPAKRVIILPNNKNIVLAAKQACYLESGKELYVVPTETIPQGLTALVTYTPIMDIFENIDAMTTAAKAVKTGQVTYAVRDTKIDGVDIKEGDILCMDGSKIAFVENDYNIGAFNLINHMAAEHEPEIIGVYYGEDVTEEKAQELYEKLLEKYPDIDIENHYGGQPLYYYIVSVE